MQRGEPFPIRFVSGLFKPKHRVPGADFSGVVESVGNRVTDFKAGEEVFGDLSGSGWGAFAEYAVVPAKAIVHKPSNVSFEEAAATPMAGMTALEAVEDQGEIQSGQSVLVIGAGGGVGSMAVQIAKAHGAVVTGVCSTGKVEMVRSLGADHVIDHTAEDVTQSDQRYDLVVDSAAFRKPNDYLPILSPEGLFVMVGGTMMNSMRTAFAGGKKTPSGRKRFRMFVSTPNEEKLLKVQTLLSEGKITPAIGHRFPLSETADAVRLLESGKARGKVVITISDAS